MTLEDFKDVYKDKTPIEKLELLIVQTDYIRDDVRSLERDRINGNEKGADYMRSEIRAKEDRIQWLYDKLAPLLKEQEPKPPVVKENSYGWKFYYCPSCGKEFFQNNKFSFCEKCGQAVKWE